MQSLPKFKNQYFSNAHRTTTNHEVRDPPQPVPNLHVYILYLGHTRVLPCPKLSMVIQFGSREFRIFQTYSRWSNSICNIQNPVQKSVPYITFFCFHWFKSFFPFFELPWYSVSIFVFIKYILVKFSTIQ